MRKTRTPFVKYITNITPFKSLILFILTVFLFSCTEKKVNTKPNVVLILADDLGYSDLSCYSSEYGIYTPNIDKVASEGVRFTQYLKKIQFGYLSLINVFSL